MTRHYVVFSRHHLLCGAMLFCSCLAWLSCAEPDTISNPSPEANPGAALLQVVRDQTEREPIMRAWENFGRSTDAGNFEEVLDLIENNDSLDDPGLLLAASQAVATVAEHTDKDETLLNLVAERRVSYSAKQKIRTIHLLKTMDTRHSREALMAMVGDSDLDVKVSALETIGYWDENNLSAVTELVDARDVTLAKAAILAVGRARCAAALPRLFQLTASDDRGEVANALWAIGNIAHRTFSTPLEASAWWEIEKREGAQRVHALAALLSGKDPVRRAAAIAQFSDGVVERDKVLEMLFQSIQDPDARVRAAACEALGSAVRSPGVLTRLVDSLRDKSLIVSATAFRALKRLAQQDLPPKFEIWNAWLHQHIN